jgi:hypothetical protein
MESAAKDTNRGVIPMLLYCDTTQVQVKQLKCDTYYCTKCRGAVRITQLLVLNEQHLQAKHRVRHHTAYNAVLQTESAAEGTHNGVIPMLLYLRYDASTSAERTARSVKQPVATLTTVHSAGEQCESTQLLVLNEQH